MTLPLIYALNKSDAKNRKWLSNSVKNHNTNKRRVKEIIAYVKEMGGLEYAIEVMKDYQQQAMAILDNYPDSPFKESLQLMVDYVIDRKI